MVKISDLCIEAIKEILRVEELPTSGTKAELVQTYIKAKGSEDVQETDNNMQNQLDEMRKMIESLTTAVGAVVQAPVNIQPKETSVDQNQSTFSGTARSLYSVKEIAESIPEFDPTDMQSITAEHFVERVNAAINAYKWDEKGLMLAVFGKMKELQNCGLMRPW